MPGTSDQPPVAGVVDWKAFPAESTITHTGPGRHATALSWLPLFSRLIGADHALAPPPGSVEVTTLPALSTAMHSVALRHVTPFRLFPASTAAVFHAAAPPVGFVDVTTLPLVSTATHSDAVGHETP